MAQRRPDRVLGPETSAFWASCDRGELRLQRCDACGKLSWPIVAACEHCGSGSLSWQLMSGNATLVSWCSFERDYYDGVLPIPWDTILVELAEGPLFVSNPKGFTCADARLDERLTLSFLDCEDAAGSFRLPVFERA